jgi:WD40 repeat protein
MATLEITLRLKNGSSWPVIAEFTSDGDLLPERAEGILKLDGPMLTRLLNEPKEYGDALGQALFQGAIQEAFVKALSRSIEPFRLLLFVEDPELRTYRWERLSAPIDQGWVQLASYQRVLFSRYLPSLTDRRFPPIGRGDLRALIVAASPKGLEDYGLGHFDENESVQGVIAALGEVPYTLLATSATGASGPPTLNQICERITNEAPTLLHIVAHGRALDDESLLYLSRDDNPEEVDAVTATRLRDRLAGLRGEHGLPHLIFLSTCESASPDADGTLGGLGQRLVIELGVPAVVAMADRVQVTTANALSKAFYGLLIKQREVDRALVEATAGLAEANDITVPVLYSRLGGKALFDETVKRSLTSQEIERGIRKLEKLLDQRAPSLKDDLHKAADLIRRTAGTAEAALSDEIREERKDALAVVDTISNEAVELSFNALATGAEPPRYDGHICPFPGLAPFSEQEARFFFGRRQLAQELHGMLKETPCVTIVGISGSGKTSLVLAGLLPLLHAENAELGLALITPGELPLAALERELYVQNQAGKTKLLVVIDQFEELFTVCTSDEERQHFVARLLKLPAEHPTVILLRPDFLDECEAFPDLYALINDNIQRIEPMPAEALREVIEQQAAAVGLRFEAGLTTAILQEVRDQAGRMPLTQHALRELWGLRRGRWLRLRSYEALGGVQKALATSANQVYNNSSPADKDRLRNIFVRLTRIDREANAGDQRDTRQRALFEELVPVGDDPKAVRSLVERLTTSRLLVSNVGPGGSDQIELGHEALIRSWPLLQTWLSEDRDNLVQLADLRQQVQRWRERGRDASFLLRDAQLNDASALTRLKRYPLNGLEAEFINGSMEAQEAAREQEIARLKALADAETRAAEEAKAREQEAKAAATRFRFLAMVAAGVAAVALVAMIVAAVLGGVAQSNAVAADTSAREARTAEAEAVNERRIAEEARDEAQAQRATAVAEQQRADANAREANLRALVSDAQAALGRGDADQAMALSLLAVEQGEPSARSFFTLAESADTTSQRRYNMDGAVSTVAFSPDENSSKILAADENALLVVWDRLNNEEIRRYEADGPINTAAFSPDGQQIILGTDTFYDAEQGQERGGQLILVGATDGEPFAADGARSIEHIIYSPNGQQIITGGSDGTISFWDVASRREIGQLTISDEETAITGFGYGFPGSLLVASDDGFVRELAVETGSIAREFKLSVEYIGIDGETETNDCFPEVMKVLLQDDYIYLFVGCSDGKIQLWGVSLPGIEPASFLIQTYAGHDAEILSLAYTLVGDRGLIVSSSLDQTVRLWDMNTTAELADFQGHAGEVNSVEISADGEAVLTGSFDRSVRLWEMRGGQRLDTYVNTPNAPPDVPVVFLRVIDDGTLAIDRSGYIVQWDVDGNVVNEGSFGALPLALSPDGTICLGVTDQGEAIIFDTRSGETKSTLPLTIDRTTIRYTAAFSPDNSKVVISVNGEVLLFNTTDGTAVEGWSNPDVVITFAALAFSPDGKRLLGATDWFPETQIILWNIETGEELGRLIAEASDQLTDVLFSPDGKTAFSASWDRKIRQWDLSTFEEIRSFSGHTQRVNKIALSADGSLLLSGGADYTVRLWEVATGEELSRFEGHNAGIVALVFIDNDQAALSIASDDEAIEWRTETANELVTWVRNNRTVPELSCAQQAVYGLCSEPAP